MSSMTIREKNVAILVTGLVLKIIPDGVTAEVRNIMIDVIANSDAKLNDLQANAMNLYIDGLFREAEELGYVPMAQAEQRFFDGITGMLKEALGEETYPNLYGWVQE